LIETGSSTPLYQQFKDQVLSGITNGTWQEGDRLPTENDFHEKYNLSRSTIRHALSDLEREGFIDRHPGKGTIVCHKRIKPEIMKLSSFSDDMKARGMKAQSKTIEMKLVEPPQQVREGYGIQTDEQVWLVRRLRSANGKPMALQDLYIPPDLQISARDLQRMQSYYQLIKENHDISPAYATEVLSAKSADKEDAELMDIDQGDPLIFIWRVTYAQDESVLEVVKIKYIAERYKYHIQLYV